MPVAIKDFEIAPAAAPKGAEPATPAAPPPPREAERREQLRRAAVRLASRRARLGDR